MLELIGLVAGLLIGAFFPWTIPAQWSLYVAAGLLAALDSALGGFRARVKGEFKLGVFLSGTIGNAAIAVFLTWLGQKLGLPLYLAAGVRHPDVPKLCGNPAGAIDLQAKES